MESSVGRGRRIADLFELEEALRATGYPYLVIALVDTHGAVVASNVRFTEFNGQLVFALDAHAVARQQGRPSTAPMIGLEPQDLLPPGTADYRREFHQFRDLMERLVARDCGTITLWDPTKPESELGGTVPLTATLHGLLFNVHVPDEVLARIRKLADDI